MTDLLNDLNLLECNLKHLKTYLPSLTPNPFCHFSFSKKEVILGKSFLINFTYASVSNSHDNAL